MFKDALSKAISENGTLQQRIKLLSDKKKRELFRELAKYLTVDNGCFVANKEISNVFRDSNVSNSFNFDVRLGDKYHHLTFQQFLGLAPYSYQKSHDDCTFETVVVRFVGRLSFIYETAFFEDDAVTFPTQRILVEFCFTQEFLDILNDMVKKLTD